MKPRFDTQPRTGRQENTDLAAYIRPETLEDLPRSEWKPRIKRTARISEPSLTPYPFATRLGEVPASHSRPPPRSRRQEAPSNPHASLNLSLLKFGRVGSARSVWSAVAQRSGATAFCPGEWRFERTRKPIRHTNDTRKTGESPAECEWNQRIKRRARISELTPYPPLLSTLNPAYQD